MSRCQHTHTFLGQPNDYSKANKKRERRGRQGLFDRGNGPPGSCSPRDRVGVRAERRVGREGKREGRRGETGVIVGDGAESASVLRPHCLPSGGRRRQRPLKWPGYDARDEQDRRGSRQITTAELRVCGVRRRPGWRQRRRRRLLPLACLSVALTRTVFPVRSDLSG